MKEGKNSIIVGVSQYTQHKQTKNPLDPLQLILHASKNAIKDTGVEDFKLIKSIDSVILINVNSWSYKDSPGVLCKALGIKPKQKIYLADGGNTPQMAVNRASKALFYGQAKAVLIAGGEAAYTAYKSKKTQDWPPREKPASMEGKIWNGINDHENLYGFKIPSCTYAIFENALRSASQRTIREHQLHMGKLFERFSKIASENPHAWTRTSFSAEEIITPTDENRMINFPYTKRMCSNMFVDQVAAIIMMTEEVARRLNIDEHLWVYLMGGSDFQNIHEISRRPKLYDSPAAREGSKRALKQAGLRLNEINAFDIYSCFPSIVQIIKKEIGILEDDPRTLTIAGGLPYFGGPWSNYSMHAIVTAVEKIRDNSDLKIMVIANGGYNTKQSFGIYGKNPPLILWDQLDDTEIQSAILSKSLAPPLKEANGVLEIESYTFVHDRQGNPVKGIVIGKIESNRRALAQISADRIVLNGLLKHDLIGKKFPVKHDPSLQKNIITLNSRDIEKLRT